MRALKAINDIVPYKLTCMEQGALARMLEACQDDDGKIAIRKMGALARMLEACQNEEEADEACIMAYNGAVDFLWMAFRISDEEKEKLLELVYGKGWWKP